VLVADAQKVKGLAPLACKTDKIDARVLALLSQRDLVPAIWLPESEHSARARVGALSVAGLSDEVCVVAVTDSALVAGKDTDDHQHHL
jgi:hypothetical protein